LGEIDGWKHPGGKKGLGPPREKKFRDVKLGAYQVAIKSLKGSFAPKAVLGQVRGQKVRDGRRKSVLGPGNRGTVHV